RVQQDADVVSAVATVSHGHVWTVIAIEIAKYRGCRRQPRPVADKRSKTEHSAFFKRFAERLEDGVRFPRLLAPASLITSLLPATPSQLKHGSLLDWSEASLV